MSESSLRPHHQAARELSELCAHFGLESDADLDQIEVTGVTSRVETTRAGDLYIAIDPAGSEANAIAAAVERGAVAVIAAPLCIPEPNVDVPVLVVSDPALALGPIASWVYRTAEHDFRMLVTLGGPQRGAVARCADAVLALLGQYRALMESSVARINDEDAASIASPARADDLHALLARLREMRVDTAVFEFSSDEMAGHHLDEVEIDVVTYCGGLADEPRTKAMLADAMSPDHSRRAVVLVNDALATHAVEESRVPVTTVGLGVTPADWQARIDHAGRFTLRGRDDRIVSTVVHTENAEDARTVLALALVALDEAGWALEQLQDAFDRNDGLDLRGIITRPASAGDIPASPNPSEPEPKGTLA